MLAIYRKLSDGTFVTKKITSFCVYAYTHIASQTGFIFWHNNIRKYIATTTRREGLAANSHAGGSEKRIVVNFSASCAGVALHHAFVYFGRHKWASFVVKAAGRFGFGIMSLPKSRKVFHFRLVTFTVRGDYLHLAAYFRSANLIVLL